MKEGGRTGERGNGETEKGNGESGGKVGERRRERERERERESRSHSFALGNNSQISLPDENVCRRELQMCR